MPRCPNCFSPMVRVEEDGIKSASCPNCFGTWMADIALLRRVRKDAEAFAGGADCGPRASLADLAEIVQASDTRQAVRCPQCEKPMLKDRYHPMIPVQIDRCKACRYVWLDTGELSLIRQLYVELMTSDDPEIVRRRDKLGAALSAWDARRVEETFGPGDSFDDGFDPLAYLLRNVTRF
jgi:Zn-finger nucleic acid-binding protein